MRDTRSLRLELAPSPVFAAAILVLHVAAAVSSFLAVPGPAGSMLAAAFLALGAATAWARALLRSSSSVRAIELQGATSVVLELANGDRVASQIAERRYVGRFMVNIPVVRPARRTLLVVPDMLATDSFRRLRVWALWGKLPGVAGKQLPF